MRDRSACAVESGGDKEEANANGIRGVASAEVEVEESEGERDDNGEDTRRVGGRRK